MKARLLPILCALLPGLLCLPLQAEADCLTQEQIEQLASAYAAREPADNPRGLSIGDAQCSRAEFNAVLQATLGEPVGYKAGLTNSAVQQRFRHASPVRGSLYVRVEVSIGIVVDYATSRAHEYNSRHKDCQHQQVRPALASNP